MASITLSSLKPTTATLQVKHPVTGETEFELPDGSMGPLELYVVGRNSPQWVQIITELKKNAEGYDVFSKISEDAHKFLASLIVGWKDNGAIDTPYSYDEALSLIKNPDNIWLVDQLQQFILEEKNFFLTI